MILLVDDDPVTRSLYEELLSVENFSTEEAANGFIAIEKANTMSIKLILLDLMMPGISGLDTLKKLKENPRTREIPVIIVTAVSNRDDFKRAFELGAIDYLIKPVSYLDLVIKVKNYLNLARKEVELRNSELRFKSIVEDQTEFIIRYASDGVITFVNDAFCRYLQKSREDLLGTEITDDLIFDDGQQVLSELKSLNSDDSISTHVRQISIPPGKNTWQEWVERALFDEHGRVLEYQCVGRDITVQKGYQDTIRILTDETAGKTGESFFRALLRNLVKILSANHAILGRINPDENKQIKIYTSSREGIKVNKHDPELIKNIGNLVTRARMLSPGTFLRFDDENLLPDPNPGESVCLPLYNSNQQVLGVLIVIVGKNTTPPQYIIDIIKIFTVRAAAELERSIADEKLIESELKFRNIFHSSNDIIVISDFNHKILESNRTFFSVFHGAGKEVNHLYVTDLIHENDLETYQKWVEGLQTPILNNSSLEVKVITHDNKLRTMEIRGKIIQFKDRKAVLAILRDITERKEVHLQVLNAIIKTEEKERRRYAQDLHDGLGPLLSAIKLYLKSVFSPKDEQSRITAVEKSLEIIDEAIESIREIANNISPNILRDFGLDVAVKSFISKFHDTEKINIYYQSDLKKRFNKNIEASLYRIIIELINNTIKHACAGNITIELVQHADKLILFYSDDGKGFDLKSVMDRSNGRGLQNIIHRIESVNGEVTIETEPDKGFDLYLNVHNSHLN